MTKKEQKLVITLGRLLELREQKAFFSNNEMYVRRRNILEESLAEQIETFENKKSSSNRPILINVPVDLLRKRRSADKFILSVDDLGNIPGLFDEDDDLQELLEDKEERDIFAELDPGTFERVKGLQQFMLRRKDAFLIRG